MDIGGGPAWLPRTWTGCGPWRPSLPCSSRRPASESPCWSRPNEYARTPPDTGRRSWNGLDTDPAHENSAKQNVLAAAEGDMAVAQRAWSEAGLPETGAVSVSQLVDALERLS